MKRTRALLFLVAMALVQSVAAKPRIVSINVCTDQLLIDLADPAQILGVSAYAKDKSLSWVAERAEPFAATNAAEAVIRLRPDLVMAGIFNKRETREVLAASGLPVEAFDLPNDFEAVKAAIARAGALLQQEDRAQARIGELDAALLRLQQAALPNPVRVLPLQRRGWVSGAHTLISELLSRAGLLNVANEIGLNAGGQMGLERLIAFQPDLILASRDETLGEDQGSALLLHPALQARVPSENWIYIPGKLTVCGGPGLIEAIDILVASLERLAVYRP